MGRLATDIGGTFTDLVYFDEDSGDLKIAKSLTTPKDLTQGVLDTIAQAAISGVWLFRSWRHDRHQRDY
jgi:N-methylhydantoinase A